MLVLSRLWTRLHGDGQGGGAVPVHACEDRCTLVRVTQPQCPGSRRRPLSPSLAER